MSANLSIFLKFVQIIGTFFLNFYKNKAKFDVYHIKILKFQNTRLFFSPITEKLTKKKEAPHAERPFFFFRGVHSLLRY